MSIDKEYAYKKIGLLFGHENFEVVGLHFGSNFDGDKVMYVNVQDNSINEWCEVAINLNTGKAEVSES